MKLLEQLRTIIQALNSSEVRWALIGGLAVSVRSEPRTTKDIDVAVVLSSDQDEKKLVKHLEERGFSNKQLIMHVNPTMRLGIRVMGPISEALAVPVDILFASSGIEEEVVAEAEPIEIFPGIEVPVATLAHLIAMKVVSENDHDRLRDQLDLQALLQQASKQDLDLAREMLQLIKERGFSRDKDLSARFEQILTKEDC